MTAAVAVRAGTTNTSFQATMLAVTAVPWLLLVAYDQEPRVLVLAVAGVAVAHVASTGSMYVDPEMRPLLRSEPKRLVLVPAGVLVAGTMVTVFGPAALIELTLGGLAVWTVHHFTKQNAGVVAFACKARGAERLSSLERRLMTCTTVAAVLALTPLIRPFGTPIVNLPILRTVGVLGLLGLAAVLAVVGHRGDPVRAATLAGCAVFYWPLFLCSSTFAATAAYSCAHGLQYLVMCSHARHGREGNGGTAQLRRFLLFAVAGGAAFYWLTLQFPGATSHPWAFGLYQGIVVVHFLSDGMFWRLSEPFQRGYMQKRFAFL